MRDVRPSVNLILGTQTAHVVELQYPIRSIPTYHCEVDVQTGYDGMA